MKNKYFILSSSCKLVKGYTRSVIVDYNRGDLIFISIEYADLINNIDRKLLADVYAELEDKETMIHFEEFLDFLLKTEIAFLADDVERFPKISDRISDDYVLLQDVIIELDENHFNEKCFQKLCKDLKELGCKDFQFRILSNFNVIFLNTVIEMINSTSVHYLEIHGTFNEQTNTKVLHEFIENNAIVSKIFIYNSPSVSKYQTINDLDGFHPFNLGEIWFVDYPFDNGNCCGIINFENLNFTSFHLHNKLKLKNGCLDKKITIDRYGNIKNCPSLNEQYGNIETTSLKEVLKNKEFTKYWNIHKDQIETCKICEFRYNCTDCRAFIQNPKDIYSKPAKCSYNPITCKWED